MVDDSEKVIENRKNRLKKTFTALIKDNYDKLFLIVLAIAFVIRLWIFFKTMDQTLWWDGADYLSTAKKWGLGLDTRDIWYYRRGFLWPLFTAFFFITGMGEIGIRFAGVLFSTGIIILSYLLISEMFNKKLAFLTSIGLTLSWIFFFFTGRILTDIPATFFLLIALLFFWKGYMKGDNKKFIYLFGLFFALAVLTRMQYLMFVPVFIIASFFKQKFRFLKNKHLWIAIFVFFIVLTPHIITYWNHYGNPAADITTYYLGIKGVSKTGEGPDRELLNSIRYFKDLPYILYKPLIFFFLIGAIYFFADLFLGIDKIFSNEKLQAKLFVFFWIVALFLAIGYTSAVVEQRYVIPGLTFLFLLISVTMVEIDKALVKHLNFNKNFSFFLIVVLLISLMIPNLLWGNQLTEAKKTSYLEVKQAGEWIKSNSNPEDKVITNSLPQITYYSERDTYPFDVYQEGFHKQDPELMKYGPGKEGLESFINDKHPRYLILSKLEPHQDWMYSYQQDPRLKPVQAFPDPYEPTLLIYEFDYSVNSTVKTEL